MTHPQRVLQLTEDQRAALGDAAQDAEIQPVRDFSDVETILELAQRVLGKSVPDFRDLNVTKVAIRDHFQVEWDGGDIWVNGGYEEVAEFQTRSNATSREVAEHVVQKLIDIRNHIVAHLTDRGFRL